MVANSDPQYKLPKLFEEILEPLKSEEQRQMALLTSLTFGGAMFSKAYFKTAYKTEKLNLYILFSLPAASGKGIVDILNKMMEPAADWAKGEDGSNGEQDGFKAPEVFSKSTLLMPTNITAPRMLQKLQENDWRPTVMVETELDTVVNSERSEHGRQLSVILRQAYHNEKISLSRKKDDEDIEIKEPWLAAVFAGTPNQLYGFFRGNADGKFSRFLVFAPIKRVQRQKSTPIDGQPSLERFYAEIGDKMKEIFIAYHAAGLEIIFPEDLHNKRFEFETRWDKDFKVKQDEDFISVVTRAGGKAMRIAGVLTAMRHVENNPYPEDNLKLVCTEEDMDFALNLVDQLMDDTHRVYNQLGAYAKPTLAKDKVYCWFNELPNSFETSKAVILGDKFKIRERTVKKYLSDLTQNNSLLKESHGKYRKVDSQNLA